MTFLLIWLFFGACTAILNAAIIWAVDDNFNQPRTKVLSWEIGFMGIFSLALGIVGAVGIVMAFFVMKLSCGKRWPHDFWG